MEKELKIVPPEGYEIDKENSTFECIKFKKSPNRWREENDLVNGYTIINDFITKARARFKESCIFFSRKQAKSALAGKPTKERGLKEWNFLAFHTAEQRDLFLEENEDLVKDYLMID